MKIHGIRGFLGYLLGKSSPRAAQPDRADLERVRIGRERLDFLFQDLGLLTKAGEIYDPRPLARELILAAQELPERMEIRMVIIGEAEGIEQRHSNVLSPRDGIVLAARDMLACENGMDRRGFLRAMGMVAAGGKLGLARTFIAYPPHIPEFSRSKLVEQITEQVLRSTDGFRFVYSPDHTPGIFPVSREGVCVNMRWLTHWQSNVVPTIQHDSLIRPGMTQIEIDRRAHFYHHQISEPFLDGMDRLFTGGGWVEVGNRGEEVELAEKNQNYWLLPWLGIESNGRVVFHSGAELPFVDGLNFGYTLPWEVNLF